MRAIIKALGIAVCIAAMMPLVSGAAPPSADASQSSLYGQSAALLLEQKFPDPDISYLLLDATTGALLAERWPDYGRAVPVGSLVKPFTAFAYGQAHDFRYPTLTCDAQGCWLPRGHGRIGLTKAVGYSCNSYFAQLSAELSAEQVRRSAQEFGLQGPPHEASGNALFGARGAWEESPAAIARAYLELAARRSRPGTRDIVAGMAFAARNGTGRAVGNDALVKTGTSKCTHARRAPGDGFVVVMAPADSPRILLLVRKHGVPGAQAAVIAGEMLRALRGGTHFAD